MDKNRNYFIAIGVSVLILIAWQFLYINPKMEAERLAQQARQTEQSQQAANGGQQQGTPAASGQAPASGQASAPGAVPQTAASRDQAIAQSARVPIDTEALAGSINLTGGRLDDLKLKEYHETVDPKSPIITLFSPAETQDGYFTELGYIGDATTGTVPGPQTVWTATDGATLTSQTPVTLTYTNEKGLNFTRVISVDDHFMFKVEDTIANASGAAVSLSPYGRVTRFNKPATPSVYVLHEGFIGVIGEHGLQELAYGKVEDAAPREPGKATGGWLGITDKYWAAAIVPPQAGAYDTRFAHFTDGRPRYQADFRQDVVTVDPGQSVKRDTLVFAGAKQVPLVDGYEASYNIPQFDLLIDWGWFYFITKPMFKLMDFFFRFFGNFGVAILLTTIVVKALFFPLASKQYASMANMKKVQPKMEELKKKFGDDRMGLQQAMMQLYKDEKINPVAGCWPILLQIPVFFALYKVIYVTIEMRHAPFFGWIQDLSAPDPTSLFNLFGLLPFAVPHALMIGVWPLVMGVTMFLQMRMNPTPPDPTQAMLFTWMPVVFTFMLASFPAGLVIYWAWNNTLSIIQQAFIMKRHGAKIELFDNLKGLFSRKPKPAE
ncbi:membrane protein insertase YidC [Rhizobium sp. CC-YZS058]|uniref:membrane protein insertase YidC n=1 Tax=Rhizobium sp. CC-YZS058 TaxID=3042153 RepID=UPI002B05AE98|nr:membrane protein insertase YidC [Rhizobium sp. CC-YZS058]MEA3536331.1 membrane protein insertase YidC [Rhizobium sp. CC-YZS058]